MKKTNTGKLGIKKITLKHLDEPTLDQMAGGSIYPVTCPGCITKVGQTCPVKTCVKC